MNLTDCFICGTRVDLKEPYFSTGRGYSHISCRSSEGTIGPPVTKVNVTVSYTDTNVIHIEIPREWSLTGVFHELRSRCGIVEPKAITIVRTDKGWSAKAVLSS